MSFLTLHVLQYMTFDFTKKTCFLRCCTLLTRPKCLSHTSDSSVCRFCCCLHKFQQVVESQLTSITDFIYYQGFSQNVMTLKIMNCESSLKLGVLLYKFCLVKYKLQNAHFRFRTSLDHPHFYIFIIIK